MDVLLSDLRHSVRLLLRSPAFSIVAVLTLALGIGANTAIFSVIDGVLLHPLPYPEAGRLVRLVMKFPDGDGTSVSIPKYAAWTANTPGLAYACAYNSSGPGLNLSGRGMPELVKGIHVSAGFFPVFGVQPEQGRVFSDAEDHPNGPKLAVISHGLALRHFGGRAAVGQSLVLNNELYTVAGVLPPSFRSYPPADVFLPLQADLNSTNQGHYLSVAARLKPGVSIDTVNAQIRVAAERFRHANPGVMGRQESARAVPFQESMVGDIQRPLYILMCAVGLVLLIACANVANLLLARASDRAREIAIRGALGSSRWRIVRQLLTESVVLSLAGGLLGCCLGVAGSRALIALSPKNLPRVTELADASLWNGPVLLFTLSVAFLTGVLFGLFPAIQISRTDVNSVLKESGSRTSTGRRHYARNALIVGEIAVALVLLIGAGLLIRTFAALRQVDAGFDPHNVLTFATSLAGSDYKTTQQVHLLTENAVRRIEQVPGVVAAATVPFLPLEGGFGLGFTIVGRPLPPGEQSSGGAGWMYVSRDYFKALRIPLLRGRTFGDGDSALSPLVVVVNQAFAKKFWPKQDAIGQRIEIGKGMGPDFAEGPREIVGIIGDVKEGGLGNPAPEVMYIPLSQLKDSFTALNNAIIPLTWIVRTSGNPLLLAPAVQHQMQAADGRLAIAHVRAVDEVVQDATAREDFNMTLLTVFSAMALLLSAIGVYGMLSYSVQQRSQEIGIRLALGAGRKDVRRMVVRQGMTLACLGIAIGVALALALSRLLKALLFDVKPTDPVTFALMTGILIVVAVVACLIPAIRATRVDPMVALRYE